MKQITLEFTMDQLETLVLACGIAAMHSTSEESVRILAVRRQLIHSQVVSQDIACLCDILQSTAKHGKVVE